MKKAMFIGPVVMVAVLFGLSAVYAQPMGPGMMGGGGYGGYGNWYCPWGGQFMGPGMMGPGMMHPGWGMGPQYGPQYGPPQYGPQYRQPQYGPQYRQPPKPMDEKEAKEILENYLKSTRNPNLKLGEMRDKGSVFEAEIVTKKEGSLVDKIAIDKYTGWMRSVY